MGTGGPFPGGKARWPLTPI